METVNMHQAKTHLSRLIDRLAHGESFVIAKAGKPVAKVIPFEAPDSCGSKRLGFLAGQIRVPDDFDRMGGEEVEALFDGAS